MFCDNVFATYLAVNPINHARAKHLEADLHFIRERVSWGDISVKFIPSSDQLANILTKGLVSS